MAIDSSVFGAVVTAAAHTVGEIIPLGNIAGPANVRSGRGAAILKNIQVGNLTNTGATVTQWAIHVKNSDWVDDVISVPAAIAATNFTALSPESGCSQIGHDCQLTPNSGWQVYAECIRPGTETNALDLFALIDVDYPSVAAVTDPTKIVGTPSSIPLTMNVNYNADGTITSATWNIVSVDYFKAGFKYCLEKVEMPSTSTSGQSVTGFVAFSNAAGMGGLQRIIPITNNIVGIRYPVKYASTLVKGPMDVKAMLFANTGTGPGTAFMVHDFVKKVE